MQPRSFYRVTLGAFASLLLLSLLAAPLAASSHREAPLITELPKVDATDFYMFRSYESGQSDNVTLLANYQPLQDPYGGPNYFTMDEDAAYAIHIDRDGDGIEDLSFVFDFRVYLKGLAFEIDGATVPIPLVQAGVLNNFGNVNRFENYAMYICPGQFDAVAWPPETADEKSHLSHCTLAVNDQTGGALFGKAIDNIGEKTFPNYDRYSRQFVMDFSANGPGACTGGRVFVGQRDDPFFVNLGETFDLINFDPLGSPTGNDDDLDGKSVTSIAVEVPIACLTGGAGPVIGGWTTASLPQNRQLLTAPSFDQETIETGTMVQVSRLGMPLVNEVVIGLPDKNLFNAVRPEVDAALATYVTNPTLPELIEILFPVQAPNNFPRTDLVAAFATGIQGLNFLSDGAPHEYLRLNTSIPATPRGSQNVLGVLGGDNAGFPNGRRPADDVVDIELRVAMGVLCHAFPGVFCDPADAPSGTLPYTDGVRLSPTAFPAQFPYQAVPIAGNVAD